MQRLTCTTSTYDTPSAKVKCAFTLLEMLAVIIILGLITSLATWSISNAADQSILNTLADRWRIFDSNARLLAQRNGTAVVIENHLVDQCIQAQSQSESADDALTLRFDYRTMIQIQAVEIHRTTLANDPAIVFIDHHGRSQDYAVTIQFIDGSAQPALTLNISGMTGLIRAQKREG